MEIGVCSVLRVVNANGDGLGGYIKPLVLDSLLLGLDGELRKVWSGDVQGRMRLVALQHHVQERLDVHEFVLKANPNSSTHMTCDLVLACCIEISHTRSDLVLIGQNLVHGRPLFGDLGVGMAQLGVVDIGVDAALKNCVERDWVCRGLVGGFGQLDVEKSRDVAKVEDARIAQLDGLLQQLVLG